MVAPIDAWATAGLSAPGVRPGSGSPGSRVTLGGGAGEVGTPVVAAAMRPWLLAATSVASPAHLARKPVQVVIYA